MIKPRSTQSQWFQMLAPSTTRLQQHMCIHDENQSLKSQIKLHYHKFLARLPRTTKPRDTAPTKMQVRNFIYRLIISLNFKFLAFLVSEFLCHIKKFLREKRKPKNKNREKKSRNCHNLNLGADTAFKRGSKFENFILLQQLVFKLEWFKPPNAISVFWLENPYHLTNRLQNLHKDYSLCTQSVTLVLTTYSRPLFTSSYRVCAYVLPCAVAHLCS